MFMDGNLYGLPDPDFLSEYYTTGGRIPQATRFSEGTTYGVWYGARELDTTVYETAWHWFMLANWRDDDSK